MVIKYNNVFQGSPGASTGPGSTATSGSRNQVRTLFHILFLFVCLFVDLFVCLLSSIFVYLFTSMSICLYFPP